jgi:hypothetical protein
MSLSVKTLNRQCDLPLLPVTMALGFVAGLLGNEYRLLGIVASISPSVDAGFFLVF